MSETLHRISETPGENLPRERMQKSGPESLSDSDLLAILLRTGNPGEDVLELSRRILRENGGLRGLRTITLEQLNEIRGIKLGKAAIIMAAIELGRRFSKLNADRAHQDRINSPDDVYDYVHYEMEALDHEELWVINLDTKNHITAIDHLYSGTINQSSVRVGEIFRKPIIRSAYAIILVHNHPSGDPQPSTADILTTKSVMSAGKMLEIPVLDHIVIGKGRWVSIKSLIE